MYGDRKYSPTELLNLCKVDALRFCDTNSIVCEILALVVAEKDPTQLREKLGSLVFSLGRMTSIGAALDHLYSVYSTGNELQGGLDGLDALTYHLSGSDCRNGITALNAVLKRFDETKEEETARLKQSDIDAITQ